MVQNSKVLDWDNEHFKNNSIAKKVGVKEYKIYTPDIVKKYKACFKTVLKISKDRNKTIYIMQGKVKRWYKDEKNLDLSLEKIYIKTKLGSYLSGGCGIGASILASFIASGVFSCINNYLKKFGIVSLICYGCTAACFGISVLISEDNQVEMYNMFLEVLDKLENHKNEN